MANPLAPLPGGRTSSYALHLIGPPGLSLDGEAGIAARMGGKELALLAFLVLEPGSHGREELAALLWGESSDTDARASLRQVLKHLREAVGPLLHVERSWVRLDPLLSCDIVEFRNAAASDPAAAAAFDIPHALVSFSVRHAPGFDEWLERTRGQLMREYHDVLAAVGREALARHAWRDALQAADRWLATDSLSESAIRLAVESTYLSGDRRGALARFTEYRASLLRETGDSPGRALLAFIRRIETDGPDAGSTDAQSHPTSWYASSPPLQAALVERDPEWQTLTHAWKSLGNECGAIVVIDGEAGAGKTRLADEFLRWVNAEGGCVLRGRGYGGGAGVPYGALVEALREAVSDPAIGGTAPDWLAEVARLLPELRQRFPGLPPAAPVVGPMHGNRLYEGVAQILLTLAAEQPVVLAIDDLQWCDEDACSLLMFLIRRLERAPVLWLGMLTLGELDRDAPAARLSRVWRTRQQAVSATLSALTADGVWTLVRELGRLEESPEAIGFARRLHEVTGGNPFYVHELLKTLFARDVLRQDEESGAWILPAGAHADGALEVPMSRSVHDAIAERVERLPDMAHDVLVTVAVAETGCDTEVLSHVHSVSRLHAAAIGDALVERRLLIEDDDQYHCAHSVIGRVVRDGLSPSRRREVHRALALTLHMLADAAGTAVRAADIARHADRGGETALAYRAALAASRAAHERFTRDEALSWLDQAASYARSPDEASEVNRLTALLVDSAADS